MITATLEESDYLHAQSVHRKWSMRKAVVVYSLNIVAVGAGWALWGLGAWSIAAGILGGVVGGVVAGSIVSYIYVPWKAKRVFRQQKSLQREFTLSWDADGVRTKSENGAFSSNWSDFLRWKESETLFLLYLSDIQFLMIPKRAFGDKAEIEDFRGHLA